MINLNTDMHIHFIGIGGIGNSAIAKILLNQGFKVSGSDLKKSDITQDLSQKGAIINIGHKKEHVQNADLVVFSSAITNKNPEMIQAENQNIKTINRAEMLGYLIDEYKKSIAVSGTHGKTTTTSMITHIMNELELNPTALIGGNLESINGNTAIGKKEDIIITEACEYKKNFLNLKPTYGIILNIEEDHLDYFEDINDIAESFIEFAKNIDKDGALIVNNDNYNTKRIEQYIETNYITIGIEQESDYQAKNITFDNNSFPTFEIYKSEESLGKCTLNVPGKHNIYNALSAIVLSNIFINDINKVINAISSFKGVHRRFEFKGEFNKAKIVDDYAHHPTEIKATLNAAKKMSYKKIRCVFQPHTFSRTKELLNEFAIAFKEADEIIITDIYAAREENTFDISSKDLVKEINKNHSNVNYIGSLKDCSKFLEENIKENELILLLGAGDINKISDYLLK
ncbi:MAG: UDP-N-acetylmuramate--L-alanine ligase [Bacillota bacterium]